MIYELNAAECNRFKKKRKAKNAKEKSIHILIVGKKRLFSQFRLNHFQKRKEWTRIDVGSDEIGIDEGCFFRKSNTLGEYTNSLFYGSMGNRTQNTEHREENQFWGEDFKVSIE